MPTFGLILAEEWELKIGDSCQNLREFVGRGEGVVIQYGRLRNSLYISGVKAAIKGYLWSDDLSVKEAHALKPKPSIFFFFFSLFPVHCLLGHLSVGAVNLTDAFFFYHQ